MLLTEELLASLGLQELVPAPLAAWRPLASAGLAAFLRGLPAHRQARIVAEQMALPAGVSAATRLVALLAQSPALHKLGQVLARHRGLDADLRRQLQALESLPGDAVPDAVLASLRNAFPAGLPVELGREALARGSVAVVVPFTFEEGGTRKHGVFKILKPGIERVLAEELAIWPALADVLEQRGRALRLPGIDYRGTLDAIPRLLASEVRLDIEQRNLRAAAELFADEPGILIPRLLPWCTPGITAMERVFGCKVTDAELTPGQRDALADAMVAGLLGKPFWSAAHTAPVHADLHAGNLLATADGRLAVLDWSLSSSLAKAQREALVAMALGGLALDAARIRDAVARLGSLHADDPLLVDAVERALDRVMRGRLPAVDWVLELLDDLSLRTATGFGEDFLLFRKTWLSLSGVVGDLAPSVSPGRALFALGMRRFFSELPVRPFATPASPAFSTHVSNADLLLQVWAAPWLTALRYWQRLQRLPALAG